MTIKYLLIKCNLTLLTASGARDIQSTTTMLVSLVYFLSTQSNVGKYLTYRIPPTLPPPPPLTKVDDNQFLLWGGAYIPKNNAKGAESFVFFLNRKMEVHERPFKWFFSLQNVFYFDIPPFEESCALVGLFTWEFFWPRLSWLSNYGAPNWCAIVWQPTRAHQFGAP